MRRAITVSRQTVEAARKHIYCGVPLADLGVSQEIQNRVERVAHVLKWCQASPGQNPFVVFKALAAGRYDNSMEEWHVAKKDMVLYEKMKNEKGK